MIIDVIYAVILLLALITGLRKGLISSVFSLIAIVVAVITAVHFSHVAAAYLDKWFTISSRFLPFISFIVVFIIVIILFRLLAKAIEGIFRLISINFINKILGGLVWVVGWTMLFSTILWYGNKMRLFKAELKADSVVYEKIEPFAPKTIEFIGVAIPALKNIFNSLGEWYSTRKANKNVQEKITK